MRVSSLKCLMSQETFLRLLQNSLEICSLTDCQCVFTFTYWSTWSCFVCTGHFTCLHMSTSVTVCIRVTCVCNSLCTAELGDGVLLRGVHVHPYHSSDTRLPLCSCHDQSCPPKTGLVQEGGDQSHASLPRLGYS